MLERGKDMSAGFARIYPLYQKLQVERFQTSNASEGEAWKPLNPVYEKYKPRRYGGGPRRKSKKRAAGQWASYPFKGSLMLVGTGMLAGAAIGPNSQSPFSEGASQQVTMFTPRSMTVSITQSGSNPDGNPFDYPQYVNEKRSFMSFGPSSVQRLKAAVQQFLVSGSVSGV